MRGSGVGVVARRGVESGVRWGIKKKIYFLLDLFVALLLTSPYSLL